MKHIIYACGISNKPDTEPLESSTLTGKIVDQIINGYEVKKINFFDRVLLKPPTDKQIKSEIEHFIKRTSDATLVLLFSESIGKHLLDYKTIVAVKHPSYMSKYQKKNLKQYILDTRKIIEECTLKPNVAN